MAVTISKPVRRSRMNVVQVNVGAYATGGAALTAKDVGLTTLEAVFTDGSGGYVAQYDHTNKKLKVYVVGAAGALTEVANTTDLSAVTFRLLVVGR